MTRIGNQLKTVLLMTVLSGFVLGAGALVAPGSMYVFVGLAILMNVGTYWFSDRIVLRMNGARELPQQEAPELHQMVAELALRAGIPKPRLFLIDEPYANAFATGRNPAHGVVAVTSGIVRILTPRQLRGVLAHEIGHIANRDILLSTIAASMAAVLSYLAHALSFAGLFGSSQSDEEDQPSPLASLFFLFAAPLIGTLIQLGISRSREYLADQTGATISGDPEALAQALERLEQAAGVMPAEAAPATASLFIVNPLSAGATMMRLFSTHPPIEERARRLRMMAQPQRAAA